MAKLKNPKLELKAEAAKKSRRRKGTSIKTLKKLTIGEIRRLTKQF